jgi:adenine/guanine phosphoribosyltransferase-like PRPP-binding protein
MKKKIPSKYNFTTRYLDKIYSTEEFSKLIDKLAKRLNTFYKKHSFDAIAFTGSSGAAVAYPLSYKCNIPLICIRKGHSHFGCTYEGRTDIKNYIIIDDFIETGATIKRIKKEVKKVSKNAKLQAIFLYAGGSQGTYLDRYDTTVINVK